jgi:hypothetical protein
MRTFRLRPLVLLLCLTGCHTWARTDLSRAPAPDREPFEHVRATRADGSRVELVNARVEGDTLRGERWEIGRDGRRVQIAIPVDSVRQFETRKISGGRTTALAGGITVVVLGLVALAAAVAALSTLE